uniref:Uncharacterized protein n=1 Tax=Timema poppense TaxID=170557 RepID=A0A7R9D189_TIMPO|nr:unnamed protein product [Timema poppensis]
METVGNPDVKNPERRKSGSAVVAGRGGSERCPREFNDLASHPSLITCSAQFCAIIYKLHSSGETLSLSNKEDKQTLQTPSDANTPTDAEVVALFQTLPGFEQCNEIDAREWFESDGNDPGYQHLNNDEIVIEGNDNGSNVIESDDDEDIDAEEAAGPSHSDAYEAFQTAMNWLERLRQPEGTATQLVLLKRLRDMAAKKHTSKFNKWKTEVEIETKSSYVKNFGAYQCRGDKSKSFFKSLFRCHRQGTYVDKVGEQRKHKFKSQGSNKIGSGCSSFIEMIHDGQNINVTYYKTHCGHSSTLERATLYFAFVAYCWVVNHHLGNASLLH